MKQHSSIPGVLAVGVVAVALAGCAYAPPPPLYVSLQAGGSYGYTVDRLSDTRYKVSYSAPVEVTYGPAVDRRRIGKQRLSVAYDIAVWRASDLAVEHGFKWFKVTDRRNDLHTDVDHSYPYYSGPYFGPGDDWPWYGPDFGPPAYWSYPQSRAWIDASVTLTVKFLAKPAKGAIDAPVTRDRLRKIYGAGAAPS